MFNGNIRNLHGVLGNNSHGYMACMNFAAHEGEPWR